MECTTRPCRIQWSVTARISDNGSGIYNDIGALAASVFNTTMSNNGVEIQNFNTPVVVAMSNTIFNVSPGGHSILNDFGTVISYGYNVSSDDGGGYLNGTGDQINTEPIAWPAPRQRWPDIHSRFIARSARPLMPAIRISVRHLIYDQRGPGFDRVRNGRIDVGSFEVQTTPTPTPTPTPTATATPSATTTPVSPTPTPRPAPTPRHRPSPRPRP